MVNRPNRRGEEKMGLAGNKLPLNATKDDLQFYSKTPKHVLFAVCRDFAMSCIGEEETLNNPSLMLKEIKERVRILRDNGLLP